MKPLLFVFALLISTNALSQEITKEDRNNASTASMIASTLVKCQGSIGFIREIFVTFKAAGLIMNMDVTKADPILDGLKKDFYRIEENHIKYLNGVMKKVGLDEQQLQNQGQEEYLIAKKSIMDKYNKLPNKSKIIFITGTLQYIQICTQSADELIRVHFPDFEVNTSKKLEGEKG